MEHCVSAFLKSKEEESYKNYMSDVGYCIANTIAVRFGANEMPITKRYCDIMQTKKEKKEVKPQETADEVIERFRKKARAL